MMKFSSALVPVAALCACALLAACSTAPTGPQLGPDGKPLPQVYKISNKVAAEIPQRMQDSVNTLRAARGLVPLNANQTLASSAVAHSRDMSAQGRPWHFGSDGSSPLVRAQRAGYMGHVQGELISETYESELQTLSDWMSQTDTAGILLDPAANEMGFGWYQEPNGKLWWTMLTGDGTRGPVANVTATALGREVSSEVDSLAMR